MKDNRTLFQLTTEMAELEDLLYETGGELTPEIEEMLTATEMALSAKADGYNTLLRKMKAHSEACAEEIRRMQAMKKVAENAQKRVREHILDVMSCNGIRKIEGEFCKMSLSERAGLVIDEAALLFPYEGKVAEWKAELPEFFKLELSIDKTALKNWIKEQGIIPAGVHEETNMTLTIR